MRADTGRSNEKPRRSVKDRIVLATYAALHAGMWCEWCWAEGGVDRRMMRFEELHHILGGSGRREDADCNVVAICKFHHQHPIHGFHGSRPLWDRRRAFELKLAQGYELPPDAWACPPRGRDACPTPAPSQESNRKVTEARCARGKP